MKVLVIGGTGMIGANTAVHLSDSGHAVTVAGRHEPDADSLAAGLPVLLGDYAHDGFDEAALAPFDAVVFAAGQDIRHVTGWGDEEFWRTYQIDGVTAIAARAKRAGVGRFVQIGSYYHQVRPDLAETNPYVDARRLADEGARALAGDGFTVCTLNPPSIVGMAPGRSTRQFAKMLAWADGELIGKVPDFAPVGGTNYLSVRSLAEAVEGALLRGESGAAYLVGDENLSFRDYFQLIFDVSGSGRVLAERDEEHPFLPDRVLVPGRGATISYEPDARETELLGYRRRDVRPMLEKMAAAVR
ncbi:NAD-dependent epimerase/dehydratase family protein [Amycolatopsis sp. FU40]|uniref:NAD-dependent epimerase/dehydratase family protein n=1 Tax=Amycolatopsis sp. FU40 TaxID=2914159 RepID=UPI001F0125A4|nr:NAD-dependent epimerase/dehydratase family protein [Amycolatopsis sp. FU40]UKD58790.1 NAD-dependent epimerase/dehydratase family protein [Amycolatopsis sp. FU40]